MEALAPIGGRRYASIKTMQKRVKVNLFRRLMWIIDDISIPFMAILAIVIYLPLMILLKLRPNRRREELKTLILDFIQNYYSNADNRDPATNKIKISRTLSSYQIAKSTIGDSRIQQIKVDLELDELIKENALEYIYGEPPKYILKNNEA